MDRAQGGERTAASGQMSLESALDEAGKVVKRQKVCGQKVADSIDALLQLLFTARNELASVKCVDPERVVSTLQIAVAGPLKEATAQTKDVHSAIAKLGKVILSAQHVGEKIKGIINVDR